MTLRSPDRRAYRQAGAVNEVVPLSERMALSVEDAAKLLGISRSKAYQLVNDGTIPSVKVGSATKVPRRALEDWLESITTRKGA